jgi:hypothetical protein
VVNQPNWWQPPPSQEGIPSGPPSTAYQGLGVFDTPQRRRSKKPWVIGGAIFALIVVVAGFLSWQLGLFRNDVLDTRSVQDGIISVLKNNFGENDVRSARCPADQPVKTGVTFDCTVTVAGQEKTVSIRVLNDKPEFEVGAPR